MFSKALFVLTAVAVALNARSSTLTSSPSDPSPLSCIYGCVIPAAAQNGCSSIDDLPCVCTNSQFQSDVGACLQQYCTPGDIQTALQLQREVCGSGGLTPSFSATPSPRPVTFTSIPATPTD